MASKGIDKNTWSVFNIYIILYYIIPVFTSYVYSEAFNHTFNWGGSILYALVLIPTYFLVKVLDEIVPRIKLNRKIFIGKILNNKILMFLLSLLFLSVSSWFFRKYSLSFRQHNSITDAGGLAIVLFTFRSIFKLYIFYLLMRVLVGLKIYLSHRIIAGIIGVSFYLSLSASLDMIQILLSLLFVFGFQSVIGKPVYSKLNRALINIRSLIIIPIFFFSVLYIGMANKIGHEKAKNQLFSVSNMNYIGQLVSARTATFYVSLINSGEEMSDDYFFQMEALKGTVNNFRLRFCQLFGASCGERSEIWSINRQNYLLLNNEVDNPKTGASPGIISMVYYLPMFPLSIIFTSVYIFVVLRIISSQLKQSKVFIQILTKMLLLIFIVPLFESPLSYLNLIDPSSIYMVFFLLAFASLHNETLKLEHHD